MGIRLVVRSRTETLLSPTAPQGNIGILTTDKKGSSCATGGLIAPGEGGGPEWFQGATETLSACSGE
jgi:hypothetical protein